MTISIGLKHSIYIIYYHTPIRIRDTLTTLGGVVYLRNGLIVCDDYNSVGWWKNGVTIAVNEILTKNNIKLLNYKEALITQQAVLKKKL